MTISATTNKTIAQGNGATTVFSYNFLVQSADQLAVIYTDANGNQTPLAANLYSVSGLGNASGGTVTYPLVGSPIANGTTLTIYRTVSLKQLTSLLNQGSYNPATTEAALDYLTMIGQQLNEIIGRGIAVPIVDQAPGVTLPAQAARKNVYLAFDASGNAMVTPGAAGGVTVSAALVAVVQAATVALARAALGSTATGDALFVAASAAAARAILSAAQSGANGDITSLTAITTMVGHAVTGLLDLSGASAGQIKFPAVANASANANTLDDYEEGTWTPTLGGTATYNTQTGTYTKIGRQVMFQGLLAVNVIGTGSTFLISGLPFASSASAPCAVGTPLTLATNVTSLIAYVSTTTVNLAGWTAAANAPNTLAILGNSTQMSFGGTYNI